MLSKISEEEKKRYYEVFDRAEFMEEYVAKRLKEAELKEKRTMAKKMLDLNIDVPTIVQITNLTEEEVNELKIQS